MQDPKIFQLFMLLVALDTVKAISYKEYKVGDTYTYKGIDFYVIQNSDSDSEIVTTIKAEPLTVADVNKYKDNNHVNVNTNVSLGEANNTNGYGSVAFYTNFDRCGYWAHNQNSNYPVADSIPNYEGCFLSYSDLTGNSDIKFIVDDWINDTIKKSDLYVDEYDKKYRLLSNDDLLNLGYTVNENGGYDKTAKVPNFIYNNKYSYWIMHSYEFEDKITFNTTGKPLIKTIDRSYIDNNGDVIEFSGDFSTSNNSIFDMHAIIPVVNFRKSAQKSSNTSVKALDTIEFTMGDIVEYKGNKYYVISDNDSTMTIVKATPLTVAEVNKYGKGYINRYTTESKNTAYDNNGYGGIAYYSRRDCRLGHTSGCNSSYNSSDVKYVVDAWLKDFTNSSDLVSSNNVRLINSSDLVEIGYDFFGTSSGPNGDGYSSLPQTSDFILELKDGWTSKSYNDSSTSLLTITTNGNLVAKNLYDYTNVIYPVITLKKVGYASANGQNSYKIVSKVNSPDTGVSKAYILEIAGLIMLLSSITIYGFVRVRNTV